MSMFKLSNGKLFEIKKGKTKFENGDSIRNLFPIKGGFKRKKENYIIDRDRKEIFYEIVDEEIYVS